MMKHKLRLTVALTVSLALGNSFLWAIPARASREIAPALDQTGSEMRDVIENYNTDRGSLIRTYPDALSPVRRARLKQFYEQWRDNLTKLNFDAMGEDGRVDYLLFKNHLDHELRQLEMQIYSLHKELVESGKITNRAFHDAVLKENSIPIEMVRASLTKQKLTRDFNSNWKFYGQQP